jgi:uncharacterized membrane protein YvbJ
MVEFCPECGDQVPEGQERCPACGARLKARVMDEKTGFTWADFFNYSFGTLVILLLGVFVPLLICLVVIYLYYLL